MASPYSYPTQPARLGYQWIWNGTSWTQAPAGVASGLPQPPIGTDPPEGGSPIGPPGYPDLTVTDLTPPGGLGAPEAITNGLPPPRGGSGDPFDLGVGYPVDPRLLGPDLDGGIRAPDFLTNGRTLDPVGLGGSFDPTKRLDPIGYGASPLDDGGFPEEPSMVPGVPPPPSVPPPPDPGSGPPTWEPPPGGPAPTAPTAPPRTLEPPPGNPYVPPAPRTVDPTGNPKLTPDGTPIDPSGVGLPAPPGGLPPGGSPGDPFFPVFTPPPVPTLPPFQPPAPFQTPPAFAFDPFAYDAFRAPTVGDAQSEPGYEFASNEGQRALQNAAAAKGVLRTGGSLKDLLKWGNQFAQQNYGNVYTRTADTYDRNRGNAYTTWAGNRENAASNYSLNYGISRDSWDRNTDLGLKTWDRNTDLGFNTYDRTYKGSSDAFNALFRGKELSFEDMYRRWRDILDAQTRIASMPIPEE